MRIKLVFLCLGEVEEGVGGGEWTEGLSGLNAIENF